MTTATSSDAPLPLAGVRVVEFCQTIMGPSCGLVLADLGADVIKVEPAPDGDKTRRLYGFAAGFFASFNRNKRSLAVNLKTPEGLALAHKLIDSADVLLENYAPGTMERLGCGYEALSERNPRLIYCSMKGFLSGPYENRPALDEVVQFMCGLAYMTGPPGQPLRAGASIIDILGGTYGAMGIMAALRDRDRTGKGQFVKSALYESTALLMMQHMAGEVAAETGSLAHWWQGRRFRRCQRAGAPGPSTKCSIPPTTTRSSSASPATITGTDSASISNGRIFWRTRA